MAVGAPVDGGGCAMLSTYPSHTKGMRCSFKCVWHYIKLSRQGAGACSKARGQRA